MRRVFYILSIICLCSSKVFIGSATASGASAKLKAADVAATSSASAAANAAQTSAANFKTALDVQNLAASASSTLKMQQDLKSATLKFKAHSNSHVFSATVTYDAANKEITHDCYKRQIPLSLWNALKNQIETGNLQCIEQHEVSNAGLSKHARCQQRADAKLRAEQLEIWGVN